ncbi:HD domain-containing phosphohydrolase [Hydrogenovibrio kuenenii]|uniref:HD domain-containing phosphohydrolase n=1 Tax=Hydrogenovibrio kuenenii TaxID=63658 RepID=UPI0004656586|nr:HD domain-containing phosphohydrolase [Hydrogenovibrio kuenenii]
MDEITLSNEVTFSEELKEIYHYLHSKYPAIERVAVALYEPSTDILITFAYTGEYDTPLSMYDFQFSQSESLNKVRQSRLPRIVDDIDLYEPNSRVHTDQIRKAGFKSSYTYPMFNGNNFLGMIFFNSKQKSAFTDEMVYDIELVCPLLTVMVANEKRVENLLLATVHTTLELSKERDPETQEHMARVAHYARIIAKEVAPDYGYDDEFVEHVFMFAPLHDIGKISIPDEILRKPGKLTDEEFDFMKVHTTKGSDLAGLLLKNFDLENIKFAPMIKNVIRYHHEKVDGSGYPDGLKGDEIPLESKIVAVADIFDALTTVRPYKQAWSNAAAFAELEEMANQGLLDKTCVEALVEHKEKVCEIQETLADPKIS